MDLQRFLDEAYHSIFDRAAAIFPEFDFQPLPNGKGYRSTNSRKIDGSEGDKVGAVYYYADTPFGFKDYTRGFITVYEYLKQRDRLTNLQVVEKIAHLAAKKLPKGILDLKTDSHYQKTLLSAEILEEANNFFINCLSHKDNSYAQTPRAARVRDYLIKERGYDIRHLRMPEQDFRPQYDFKMELGYLPSLTILADYMRKKGYSDEILQKVIRFPKGAGTTHPLVIPFRNKSGMLKGFAFRTLEGSPQNVGKYLYSIGLERGSLLFGLRKLVGDKDLVVVEGVLDAVHAGAQGIQNVVALGGTGLGEGQLQEMLRAEPKRITLCLDNDKAGQLATLKNIEKLLPHTQKIQLYIATLPDGIKDIDELLVKKGLQTAKDIIYQAESVAYFYHNRIVEEARQLEELHTDGEIPDKTFDYLLERIVEDESKFRNPLDSYRYRQLILTAFQAYAFSADILEYKAEQWREWVQQKQYTDKLMSLNRSVADALSKGDLKRAELLLSERFRTLRLEFKAHTYRELQLALTEKELKDRFANAPESLDSGYTVIGRNEEQPLLLPHGAISFFCAPTSHGKTTLLINLALNVAQKYPEQEVHIFSYEEAQEALLLKTLNAHIDMDLSENNRRSLEHYFRFDSLQEISPSAEQDFKDKKAAFFEEYMRSHRLNVHYVDYSAEQLIEAIYYLKKQSNNIGAIFVDYMQLLRLDSTKKGRMSRQEELKEICLQLKDCAIDTGLPLILGAQFNREVTNHFKVHATKIGEAGDIERIASVVVGVWNNDFEPIGLQANEEDKLDLYYQPNSLYIKLLKNRGGRVGGYNLLGYNGNRGKVYKNIPQATNAADFMNVIKF